MRFVFASTKIERLYAQEKGARKFPRQAVDGFFDVMAIIGSVTNEQELRAFKSLHYEKLKGQRKHQRSLVLCNLVRLIVEQAEDADGKYLVIVGIEDYH